MENIDFDLSDLLENMWGPDRPLLTELAKKDLEEHWGDDLNDAADDIKTMIEVEIDDEDLPKGKLGWLGIVSMEAAMIMHGIEASKKTLNAKLDILMKKDPLVAKAKTEFEKKVADINIRDETILEQMERLLLTDIVPNKHNEVFYNRVIFLAILVTGASIIGLPLYTALMNRYKSKY